MIRRSVAGRLLFWLLPLFSAAIALPLLLLQWLDVRNWSACFPRW